MIEFSIQSDGPDNVLFKKLEEVQMLFEGGDDKKGLEKLKNIMKRWPDNYWATILHANYLMRTGKYKEALAECEEARKSKPERPDAYLVLARIFFALNDYEEVCRNAKVVILITPDNQEAINLFFVALHKMNNPIEAMRLLKEMLKDSDDNPELHYCGADYLLYEHDRGNRNLTPDCLDMLDIAQVGGYKFRDIVLAKGEYFYVFQQWEQAEMVYKGYLIHFDREDMDIAYELALVLLKQKKTFEALVIIWKLMGCAHPEATELWKDALDEVPQLCESVMKSGMDDEYDISTEDPTDEDV